MSIFLFFAFAAAVILVGIVLSVLTARHHLRGGKGLSDQIAPDEGLRTGDLSSRKSESRLQQDPGKPAPSVT